MRLGRAPKRILTGTVIGRAFYAGHPTYWLVGQMSHQATLSVPPFIIKNLWLAPPIVGHFDLAVYMDGGQDITNVPFYPL